jgi:(p)ppGpp synthase/HD superfamily hydrolase
MESLEGTKVQNTSDLAEIWHKGQVRKYSGVPYVEHPRAVVGILQAVGVEDEDILAAAYCHDLLEDTEVPSSVLEHQIGLTATLLVGSLTRPKQISKEGWASHFINTATGPGMLIKMADRIHNSYDFCIAGKKEYALKYFYAYTALFSEIIRFNTLPANWVCGMRERWDNTEARLQGTFPRAK